MVVCVGDGKNHCLETLFLKEASGKGCLEKCGRKDKPTAQQVANRYL